MKNDMDWFDIQGVPVLIKEHAIREVENTVIRLALKGRGIAVYEDTGFLSIPDQPKLFRSIPFDNQQLYCNERTLAYLRMQINDEADYLVAVGGEAIQSLVKVMAAEKHIPYIAVPTCAYGISMADDQAETDTAVGFQVKSTVFPAAVLADLSLIRRAEESITTGATRQLVKQAGMLASGRAAALAAGYTWNQQWMDMQTKTKAIDEALSSCNLGIRKNETEAYFKLCRALILCGLLRKRFSPNTGKMTRLNRVSEEF